MKRALDFVGSVAGLLITTPLMLATAAAIRRTMGSPVLFRQVRPGLNCQPFELVKFRTMRAAQPGQKTEEDDAARLTALGQMLRAMSIDELPTLWNVLKGDMSLVGPRPLLLEYVDRYTTEQRRRHDVKPGITGWAQINGRNALTWEDKFRLDVWYVDNRSAWLDAKIIAWTVVKVLRRDGISHSGDATMPKFMGGQTKDTQG